MTKSFWRYCAIAITVALAVMVLGALIGAKLGLNPYLAATIAGLTLSALLDVRARKGRP